jgi:hypothetical protein
MPSVKNAFYIVLFLNLILGSFAYSAGRFALTPLSERDRVRSWVAGNSERYWLEGEDKILVYQAADDTEALPGEPSSLKAPLYFFQGAGPLPKGSEELIRGGRIRVITSESPLSLGKYQHGVIRPIKRNHRLVQQLSFQPKPAKGPSSDLDCSQWPSDLQSLSSFSRYSYSSGIDAAKEWLQNEFRKIPGIQLKEHSFDLPFGKGANIIASIPGRSRPDEIYIVGAHYDSISEKPMEAAPGAEDNASGAAGLLSLARDFAKNPPEATLIFVAFSGEEEGLYGSEAWVESLIDEGIAPQIKAAFIMDMIGYSGDEELDCLLETSPITKGLLKTIQAANSDPELVLSESMDYWGSDHEPFLDRKLPAILFIENDYLDYPDYHRSSDTADKLHPTLGPKILRLIRDSLRELASGGLAGTP